MSIENFISVKHTEGPKLAASLEEHVKEYDIDVMNLQRAKGIEKKDLIEVELENGAVLKSKTVIHCNWCTLAQYRRSRRSRNSKTKVSHTARTVTDHYLKEKTSPSSAAATPASKRRSTLAGIVNHVTVLEFMPELKADAVLQERLYSLPNVTVMKNAQTKEITGTEKVNGITYIDRATGEEKHIELQGVFVQIGLVPNTEWLAKPSNATESAKSSSTNAAQQTSLASSPQGTAQTARTSKSSFPWAPVQPLH